MVSADPQRTHGPDYEKNYYESLLIVLDTLEKCLSGQPKDTTRFDEAMNVKLLLREICQFIGRNGRVFFIELAICIQFPIEFLETKFLYLVLRAVPCTVFFLRRLAQ